MWMITFGREVEYRGLRLTTTTRDFYEVAPPLPAMPMTTKALPSMRHNKRIEFAHFAGQQPERGERLLLRADPDGIGAHPLRAQELPHCPGLPMVALLF